MRVASWAVVATLMAGQVAAASDSFRDLLIVYRCEVVHRLEQIYATGDPASDRDRFIAVIVPGRPHSYVQCIFHDHQSGLYCEAASGFWYNKEGEPRTFRHAPETIAALAQIGFDTDDSNGNFNIDLSVADPPDFNAAADFILRALHDAYGARGEMNLEFDAPFAPKAPSTCVPVG